MNKVEDKRLVLCDREEEYAVAMSEYLRKQKNLPWEIHTYTDTERMLREEEENKITILVIAEASFHEDVKKLNVSRTILLNESGLIKEGQYRNINKYQAAEEVLKEILEVYVEIAGITLPRLQANRKTKFIGIYSPVKRCMQSCFARTMSELLAKEASVLYLSFEYYLSDPELLQTAGYKDLSDLLYFMTAQREKFALHMQIILKQRDGLDYIPPMRSGQNLLMVSAQEWIGFLTRIAELGDYDYVVMDLSDCMQGLFDILRFCDFVYTIVRNDRMAKTKLMHYEQLLNIYEYEDVCAKTLHCQLPSITRFPDGADQYDRWELSDYVKNLLEDSMKSTSTSSKQRLLR